MIDESPQPTPLDDVPPHRLLGKLEDDVWGWLNLEGSARCPFLGRYLPGPGDALAPGTNAAAGEQVLRHGFRQYRRFKSLYERLAGPLSPEVVALDFGCGWGRIARYFLREIAPANLTGIDVNPQAVEAARATNRWYRFETTDVLPPTRFDAATFDLVYAYSVYSHLSEEAHRRWLEEFARILKPGGVLLLTTLDRHFITQASAWADDESAPRWQRVAGACFTPLDDWLARFDRGEYCYAVIDADENPHFGFACIPEQYVRREWSSLFAVEEIAGPDGPGEQVMIAARKRNGG